MLRRWVSDTQQIIPGKEWLVARRSLSSPLLTAIVFTSKEEGFDTLFTRDNSVPVHKRNLQLLMTEIYKTKSNITPSFMTDIFIEKNPPYHIRSSNILQMPKPRTVRYGLDSISFLGCKLLHGISTDISFSFSFSNF